MSPAEEAAIDWVMVFLDFARAKGYIQNSRLTERQKDEVVVLCNAGMTPEDAADLFYSVRH